MFKRFLRAAALSLLLVLPMTACDTIKGMVQPLHAPVAVEGEDTAIKAYRLAHAAIDEANATLISINKQIGANATTGVWTKDQAQGHLDKTKALGKDVDRARETMRLGNLADANAQAQALKTLLLQLQVEIGKQARKEN